MLKAEERTDAVVPDAVVGDGDDPDRVSAGVSFRESAEEGDRVRNMLENVGQDDRVEWGRGGLLDPVLDPSLKDLVARRRGELGGARVRLDSANCGLRSPGKFMKGMSRNLYWLAASLLLFSLVSCAMSLIPNSLQPGLPVNGSVSKTIGLVFLVAALLSSLAGILTAMFEQVERRNQERMRRELNEDLARLGRNKARK